MPAVISWHDLGSQPSTISPVGITPDEAAHWDYVISTLSVTCSSLSLVAAMWSSYWFLNMRRTFRHDLLIFLIQTEMFKSWWYWVYGIVALRTKVVSSSKFCQVTGFFVLCGIEGTDFAILMVAIHSALYVFNVPTSLGEGGLYPYRAIVFIAWIVWPATIASLAFINPDGGYTTGGAICFLPVRPFWYRLALSWIPRYVIFLVILAIYASIYFYISHTFGRSGFGVGTSAHQTQHNDSVDRDGGVDRPTRPLTTYTVPPTPPLAHNGLLRGTRRPSNFSLDSQDQSTWATHLNKDRRNISGGKAHLGSTNPPNHFQKTGSIQDAGLEPGPSTPTLPTPFSNAPPSTQTSWTTFAARFQSHPPSRWSLRSFLRVRPHDTSEGATPFSYLELVNSHGQNISHIYMLQRREKTQHHIRQMFIYPVVYMGTWLIPFVVHLLQYQDKYAANPPLALTAIAVIMLRSQCFINCCVFTMKEKPWNHFKKRKNTLSWTRLKDIFGSVPGSKRSSTGGWSGRSRGEMAAEARAAYNRRDEEIAATGIGLRTRPRSERGERSWWDEPFAGHGTMTPLPEDPRSQLIGHIVPTDNTDSVLQEGDNLN